DRPAGYAVASLSRRLGRIVVRLGMHDDSQAVLAEQDILAPSSESRSVKKGSAVDRSGGDGAFQRGQLLQQRLGLGAVLVGGRVGEILASLLNPAGEVVAVEIRDVHCRFGEQRAAVRQHVDE